tara:strand:- start:354 stop:884 length:531 start_codon:yes stop_codon:yes gene_type:complete
MKNLFSDLGFEKNSICVDGSHFGSGIMQFQLVETTNRKVIYRSNEIIGGSNNIAEFLGLVYALHYVFENNDSRTIYCDSYTALKWFQQKEANTTVDDKEVLKILSKAMDYRKKFSCKYWFESEKIDPEWDAFVLENPHLRDAKGKKLERNCIVYNEFLKWETKSWGEIPADFNRKR